MNKIINKYNKLKHIAIIMDGNGRWAENRNRKRSYGHKIGLKTAIKIINYSIILKIKTLTLYTFSIENWFRPKNEVNYIFKLLKYTLIFKINKLNKKNIKLKIVGEKKNLNKKILKYISNAEHITKNNTGLILNIAFNYSGKWDIKQCFNKLFNYVKNNNLDIKEFDEKLINSYMSFNDSYDVDLLIRTGGEYRLSNFMLWQIAYTELYFTNILWPDFNLKEFKNAISFFYNRKRKFGKLF